MSGAGPLASALMVRLYRGWWRVSAFRFAGPGVCDFFFFLLICGSRPRTPAKAGGGLRRTVSGSLRFGEAGVATRPTWLASRDRETAIAPSGRMEPALRGQGHRCRDGDLDASGAGSSTARRRSEATFFCSGATIGRARSAGGGGTGVSRGRTLSAPRGSRPVRIRRQYTVRSRRGGLPCAAVYLGRVGRFGTARPFTVT